MSFICFLHRQTTIPYYESKTNSQDDVFSPIKMYRTMTGDSMTQGKKKKKKIVSYNNITEGISF